MKRTILLLINLLVISLHAQNYPEWFEKDSRDINYSPTEYWTHLETFEFNKKNKQKKSEKLEEITNKAKGALSKKISSSVSTKSNRTTVREKDVYNSIFKMNTSVSSSVTFTDLKEEVFWQKKDNICNVFVYIKKEDLKKYWENSSVFMTKAIISEVDACHNIFYQIENNQEALKKAEDIAKDIQKLESLQELLSLFSSQLNYTDYTNIKKKFDPLFADIKKRIADNENYTKNKENGELNQLSGNVEELESAYMYFKKAKQIDPNQALNDNLPLAIKKIEDKLYIKYCEKALNLEKENNFTQAIYYLRQARDIYPNKSVAGEKSTTTDKIIDCQNKLINTLISQGIEEFDDNPNTALINFKKAKKLITSMSRNDRIKEINKLIKKAEKEIKKRVKKEEKEARRRRIGVQRGKSPHRVLFSLGGGFQNGYTNPKDIFSNVIKVDVDKWHISTTLGYRLNLPTEMTTSKTGFEKTKGNVLALFYKQGNTETTFEDNNFKSNFREIEFGYIFKERIRVSLGKGNRSIHMDYIDQLPSNYNCATGSWYMHFGRLSVETSVTYLLDEKFALEKAKLNANFSLRFYLYQKIYKKTKEKI